MNLVTLELNGETTLLLINNAKVASNRKSTVYKVFDNLIEKTKKKPQFKVRFTLKYLPLTLKLRVIQICINPDFRPFDYHKL